MNSQEVLIFFSKLVEKELGIIYEDHNLYQLQDRLDQLAKQLGLKSPLELWQKAQAGMSGEFRQMLLDVSTNNETSFFRDKKFFQVLEQKILPALISEAGGDFSRLNIWSVACSTGQEPYSLAMILQEIAKKLSVSPPRILATDISQRVLAKAKSGKYTELEVSRGLPDNLRQEYFKKDLNNHWSVSQKIIDMVDFQMLNLRTKFNQGKAFDLILCRNVLIYQRVPAKVEIINQIISCLRPGGVFLLGAGESLIGLSQDFDQSLVDDIAMYRLKKRSLAVA